MELWKGVEGFEDYYEVSNEGRVFSQYYQKILKPYPIQTGLLTVGLVVDGVQHRRSVPLIVAKAWLPSPAQPDFTTPIQLDGDRWNCDVENLVWRPRWFALMFRREQNANRFSDWAIPIQIVETGEIFATPADCARTYGVLQMDVVNSIVRDRPVFPQHFHYKTVDEI